MLTLKDFKPGQLVRIHPASDWFMRGETWAIVQRVGRKWLTVKGNMSGQTWKTSPDMILEVQQ